MGKKPLPSGLQIPGYTDPSQKYIRAPRRPQQGHRPGCREPSPATRVWALTGFHPWRAIAPWGVIAAGHLWYQRLCRVSTATAPCRSLSGACGEPWRPRAAEDQSLQVQLQINHPAASFGGIKPEENEECHMGESAIERKAQKEKADLLSQIRFLCHRSGSNRRTPDFQSSA